MNYKTFLKVILFTAITIFINSLISSPLHRILGNIFKSAQQPPKISFLISIGIISIIMKMLIAVSYILIGRKMPIKNTLLRGFVFMMMIWFSDYLPQVFGITGADGPAAKAAFDIPILICDSLSYFIDGVLLGLIFKDEVYHEARPCKNAALMKTSAVSAAIFPCTIIVFDQILGHVYSPFYCFNIMQVSESKITIFYIIFYGCFIITGALLPVFYRLTEYNEEKSSGSKRFGIIYSLCIWTPVVVVMIAFGTGILVTFLSVIVFFICILFTSVINGKLIEMFNRA